MSKKNGFSKLWVERILRRFGPSVVECPWGVAGRETPRSDFQIRIVKGKSGPTIEGSIFVEMARFVEEPIVGKSVILWGWS